MKDYSKKSLEKTRPSASGIETVDFCLGQLYADRKHRISDLVAGICTYEELIGALLLARDALEIEEE